jgi:hypothetical protein
MHRRLGLALGLGIRILGAERIRDLWFFKTIGQDSGRCPDCGKISSVRHSWHIRSLQDVPAHGAAVTLKLRSSRWRCRNKACEHQTFAEQVPELVASLARRTRRAAEIVHLFGHGVGGQPGKRFLKRHDPASSQAAGEGSQGRRSGGGHW